MHRNDLMNPDLLSEIVLETYADVLSRLCGARLGKFPWTRNSTRVVALGTYQPRNRFASEAFRTYREESRSPQSRENQAHSIESRLRNAATGETAHPSPIYPLRCEALSRAEPLITMLPTGGPEPILCLLEPAW
jgi:hypothetical protein